MKALRTVSRSWTGLALVAAGLVIGLLLGRVTSVGAGANFYYSLLAITMVPGDSTIQFDNFSTAFLTTVENTTITENLTGYNGQVNLPDGSTITGMGCEGRDTDPDNEFQIYMSRFSTENFPGVVDVISSGAGSGVSFQGGNIKVPGDITTDHGQQIVNNAVWAYNIFVVLPKAAPDTTLGVLRCWVTTTYPVHLPLLRK